MFDLILFKDHTKAELDAWKIVRVSENFRVIALGLPVPRYSGNPLDPPLRSRFQARDIYYLPFKVSMNKNNLFLNSFSIHNKFNYYENVTMFVDVLLTS